MGPMLGNERRFMTKSCGTLNAPTTAAASVAGRTPLPKMKFQYESGYDKPSLV